MEGGTGGSSAETTLEKIARRSKQTANRSDGLPPPPTVMAVVMMMATKGMVSDIVCYLAPLPWCGFALGKATMVS